MQTPPLSSLYTTIRQWLRRRPRWQLLALPLVATLGIGGWLLRPAPPAPVAQATASVRMGDVRMALDATGIIKPEVGAMVKTGSRFSGLISRLYVKVGDRVSKGQLIAEIDEREQRAQLNEAEAGLLRAQAELDRVNTSIPLQIAEARAQVEAARAEASYAATMRQRRKVLVEKDLDARSVLDEAQQRATTAAAVQRAREASLRRLEREFPSQVHSAEEAVRAAEATLDTARIRLSYAKIHSPLDGVVSQVTAQEGEMVVAGFQVVNLITIIDTSRLEMWVYVDETDVGQVRQGMPVEFRVDSLPNETFSGVVDQIYPQPEIRDNIVYYQALVRLDAGQSRHLRPEMTTQCRIVTRRVDNVLTIPNEAVKWVDGQKVVFVVDGNRVRRVTPQLGETGAAHTQVLDGLREGDVVATKVQLGPTPPPNALR